jgi:uncharacterized protein (DUF2141 family)
MATLLTFLAPGPAPAATLVVRAEGIEPACGTVKVAVCARGFSEAGCPWGASRPARTPTEEVVFEDVPPGRYAVAAYQDVNGNGELDKVPPGIPTEPYAFSNDVGRLAPPSFERALVEVGEGRTVISVRLRRLLR